MGSIDLSDPIPNNVDLDAHPGLRAAMMKFRTDFFGWWRECGPQGFGGADVYLRMPTDIDARGWASYAYAPLEAYRWGLYQAALADDRRAIFGRLAGKPALRDVPGELREAVLRLLVTQADTEPASVEQVTFLGRMAPSNYDLRNLFQINCEEGRHLWAIVHLLYAHFGKAGAREVEGLLARRSGSPDKPRLLNAFNAPIEEFLSFLFWSTLADRDGKFQLLSMSESAFDPLARTARFMLVEEGHHMFVGDDGLRRVIQRTAELMRAHDTDDVAPHGGINLATLQRYLNYWAPQTIDLFGSESSARAEELFDAGLKGRPYEAERHDDHVRLDETITVEVEEGGRLAARQMPVRKALNEAARDVYLNEIGGVVDRWNRMLRKMGIQFRFHLPDKRFNRRIGVYKGFCFTPRGAAISPAEFRRRLPGWLPSAAERAHVRGLMQPCHAPGRFAGWIAPPARGIGNKPVAYAYVRL